MLSQSTRAAERSSQEPWPAGVASSRGLLNSTALTSSTISQSATLTPFTPSRLTVSFRRGKSRPHLRTCAVTRLLIRAGLHCKAASFQQSTLVSLPAPADNLSVGRASLAGTLEPEDRAFWAHIEADLKQMTDAAANVQAAIAR